MKDTVKQTEQKIRETWLFRGRLTRGLLVFAALLVVAFMMWIVFVYSKSQADQQIFEAIAPHITVGRTRFMLFITYLGNPQFLVPANLALFAFLLIRKKNWLAIHLAAVSVGGLLIKLIMKQIFQRIRPLDPVIEGGVAGFSFPSGHALMAVACYGFLIWWAAISVRNKGLQGFIIAILLVLIALISFSRVYLRVHYTTDILAGICLGFSWLVFAIWQVDKLEIRTMERRKEALTSRQGL